MNDSIQMPYIPLTADRLPGMPAHNRWCSNCAYFREPSGESTQYLVDLHRGESCILCLEVTD